MARYAVRQSTSRVGPGSASKASRAKMLSLDEERKLIQQWRADGDSAAGDRFVRSFAPLVLKNAAGFRRYDLPMDDLLQEGNVALLEAAKRFDISRGVRFATYAVWWIRTRLQEFVLRNWSIVRLGSTREQKSLFFKLRHIQARIGQKTQSSTVSNRDVSAALRLPLSDVDHMEVWLRKGDLYLEAPLADSDEKTGNFLPDVRPDPEAAAAERESRETGVRHLSDALDRLDQRERRIVQARRLAEKPIPLRLLGEEFSVSPERIRQIEQRAIGKLRIFLNERVSAPQDIFTGFERPPTGTGSALVR